MSLPAFYESPNLKALYRDMRDSPPLALVGAGASIPSGYPSWSRLMDEMEERLQSVSPQAPQFSRVLKLLNDAPWQAEELHSQLKDEFHRFIKDRFGDPKEPNSVAEPYHLIARLPFRHILTTNFDRCIELAMKKSEKPFEPIDWNIEKQAREFLRSLSKSNSIRYVVHLHGIYDNPSKIVLTESSYAERYLDENFRRRLLAIFITQPIVFIGFSMNDPDLGQLMRVVRASLGPESDQHFGIFGYRTADERELIERRMYLKYGLKAVFYRVQTDGSGGEDHSALLDLLEFLGSVEPIEEPFKTKTQIQHEGVTLGPNRNRLRYPPPVNLKLQHAALDPHKGRFGGKSENSGRRVYVQNEKVVKTGSYMSFEIVVEATPGAPPLTGKVRFQLHPTFHDDERLQDVVKGRAKIKIGAAYGAFTLGITILPENIKLELDLSELDIFPPWFRER